jgi:ADP-L-glycero-D-manno-heptose 6-epimerase
MSIVVTGAAGLIGSGVIRHLNDLGISSILAVDDLKSGEKWKNLLGKKFSRLISKHQLFDELSDEVEAIVHLGACSDTMETNVDYLMENNYRYTIRLADWALEHDKRFVYASSAATYGNGSLGFNDDEALIENLKPLNPYGFSKQLVDLWMKEQGVFGQVAGLKYFNIFGPNEYHKGRMASMVLKMSRFAKNGEKVTLFKSSHQSYKDGEQLRDFLYVKDAAKMTCDILFEKKANGLFNIGQGRPTSWNTLARALFDAFCQKAVIDYIEMPKELAGQYQNYTCANMSKFEKIFGLKTTPIELAVKDYALYLANEGRW